MHSHTFAASHACCPRAGAEETPVTWEGVPESLMDCVVAFLAGERRKVRAATAARLAGYEQGAGDADGAAAAAAATTAAASCGGAADFQRKVTPRERVVLLADMLEDEAGVDGSAGARIGRDCPRQGSAAGSATSAGALVTRPALLPLAAASRRCIWHGAWRAGAGCVAHLQGAQPGRPGTQR